MRTSSYELGLAHRAAKPVIQLTQDVKSLPFDLAHVNTIPYNVNDPDWAAKLRTTLAEWLRLIAKDTEAGVRPIFREYLGHHDDAGTDAGDRLSDDRYESLRVRLDKIAAAVQGNWYYSALGSPTSVLTSPGPVMTSGRFLDIGSLTKTDDEGPSFLSYNLTEGSDGNLVG